MEGQRKKIDDGGNAFPNPGMYFVRDNAPVMVEPTTYGMSLRDYFAVHASDEDVAAQQEWTPNTMESSRESNSRPKLTRAQCRYKHADAMLAARAGSAGPQ